MRPNSSFVEQPIRSLQTMLRVISEDDRRIPTVVPDGIYGPTTMNAISAVQRKEGLPVTGIANQDTWEVVAALYESALVRVGKAEPIEILLEPGQILRSGDSSPYVHLAQAMLAQLSHNHTTILPPSNSGVMDEETVSAITEFQILASLPPSGELNRETWKNLSRHFTLDAHKFHAVFRE